MVKVSVCLICYNQEKFIEQTLDSINNQKFKDIEVIISDDCSTDNTKEIILKFIDKNQLNWKILPTKENVGMQKNWRNCIEAATGEYIAIIEGDDFWNDPDKIKKQVGILENDKTLVACFTNAYVINEVTDRDFPEYVTEKLARLTFEDILLANNIPTCTILYRNLKHTFSKSFYKSPYVDWLIHLMNAKFGDYLFLDEKTSTYRLHESGAYGGQSEINRNLKMIKTLRCLKSIFKQTNEKSTINLNLRNTYEKVAYLYKEMGEDINFYKYKIKSKFLI
jgi:glycosyltransferase involved in cell wall biosynthesis